MSVSRTNYARLLTLGVLAATFAGLSSATPVTGTLNFSGTARVTLTGLDFFPVGGGNGTIYTLPGTNSGFFSSLNTVPTNGTVLDRTDVTQPVGVNLSVSNWLTLAAFPTTNFTLTYINPGSFSSAQCATLPAAAGQTCTLPTSPSGSQSPYELSNTNVQTSTGPLLSSTAAFSVRGTATNAGDVTNFVGRFDANFLGVTYQQLLAQVSAPGGFVDAPFTAVLSFTNPVPEPSTFLQLFSGLALAGFAAYGKSRLRK